MGRQKPRNQVPTELRDEGGTRRLERKKNEEEKRRKKRIWRERERRKYLFNGRRERS